MYNYANNNMQVSHHLSLFPGGEGEENSIFPSPYATRTHYTNSNMFPITVVLETRYKGWNRAAICFQKQFRRRVGGYREEVHETQYIMAIFSLDNAE